MGAPSPYEYLDNINNLWIGNKNFFNSRFAKESDASYTLNPVIDLTSVSIVSSGTLQHTDNGQTGVNGFLCCKSPQYTINVTSGNPTTVSYSGGDTIVRAFNEFAGNMINVTNSSGTDYLKVANYPFNPPSGYTTSFSNLAQALQYIYNNFCGVTLIVDGEQWEPEPPAPLYNWQSVPSISGKNGILSLVTLDSESINDGEPVSGAAVSVFDQNPASGNNVKDIVDGNTPLIPSAVDVTAAFIISNPPVGELASRILAAKKGSIPESIEDADKTVSIPANASNVTMSGLDENSQYYFVIFIEDELGNTASSEPMDCMTGEIDYTWAIEANTDLKDMSGNTPTLARGTQLPIYDSATESLKGIYGYEARYPFTFTGDRNKLTKMTFEYEAKMVGNPRGDGYDAGIYIGGFGMLIIATGSADAPADRNILLIYASCIDANGGESPSSARKMYTSKEAPLDALTKDTFYKMKYILTMYHGIVSKFELFVDDVLYAEANIVDISGNLQLYLTGINNYLTLEGFEDVYFRSANMLFEYEQDDTSYSLKTLEELVKNENFLTHYVQSDQYDNPNSYSPFNERYTYGSLANVRNSDYSLLNGQSGRIAMSQEDGYYVCNSSYVNGWQFSIPILGIKVKEIEFDARFTSAYISGDEYFRIMLIKYGTNDRYTGNHYTNIDNGYAKVTNQDIVVFYSGTVTWANDRKVQLNDYDWHHIKIGFYDTDVSSDFISIYSHKRTFNIKNIKFLCKPVN